MMVFHTVVLLKKMISFHGNEPSKYLYLDSQFYLKITPECI